MNPATERHPGPAAETVCPDRAAAMRAPGDLGRADCEPQVIAPPYLQRSRAASTGRAAIGHLRCKTVREADRL
jgi:hypothetical protein